MSATIPRSVFISYLPEPRNRRFNRQLQDLVERLHSINFTVFVDMACSESDFRQYGGKNRWKETHMQRAETVIVVCTPSFCKEDAALSSPGFRRKLMNMKSKIEIDCQMLRVIDQCRIVPVVMADASPSNCIPFFLKGLTYQRWPGEDLLYCVAGVPKFIPRPVQKIELRPRVINFPKAREWNPYDDESSDG